MRAFDLGKQFHLAIIPGHSFQAMLTPDDQAQCLETIRRHLRQGGVLVVHLDHQDFRWLGGLLEDTAKRFETDLTLTHPRTGQEIRRSHRWTFEPATQTATIRLRWEAYGEDGSLVDRWELDPMRLHCVFRFEMEHLLRGAGFSIEAVYGDFFKSELCDDSGQMIWVARNPAG
jgi:SAM-dependent methyltransferase